MINKDELNYLYKYALALCHDEVKAYDLVQEGLTRYIKSGKNIIPPTPYIKRIIRNYYIDQFRVSSKFVHDEFDEEVISIDQNFELNIDSKIELESLLQACSDDEREILILWGYDGLSLSEISTELDIPPGSVLSKFHRLKKRITKMYSEQEVSNES